MDQEHLDPETSERIDDAFAITLEDAIKEVSPFNNKKVVFSPAF